MLIGFKLCNFRSFSDDQVFRYSMLNERSREPGTGVRTGVRAEPRLLKTAVIFGPNGSGKTNLLVAFATMRDLVLHSTTFSEADLAERHTPFQFGASSTQATGFEIEILLEKVRYRYSLSYDKRRIQSERLLVYRAGKAQHWFDRHFNEASQAEEWGPFSPSFKGSREMWRKATHPTALFLTTAARLNSEQLQPLMHWFEHCLEVIFPADLADLARVTTRMRDPGFKSRLLNLLRAVDIQVDDLRVSERNLRLVQHVVSHAAATGLGYPDKRRGIEFLYTCDGSPVWLDCSLEAAGTYRLLNIMGLMLDAIEFEKCLMIDEFDAGIHPLVARYLMQMANDTKATARRAQLLFNSHNTALMDLSILRRDQIWLMQLDEKRASHLCPVFRFHPRKGEPIAKSYLHGRYGAVPVISNPSIAGRRE